MKAKALCAFFLLSGLLPLAAQVDSTLSDTLDQADLPADTIPGEPALPSPDSLADVAAPADTIPKDNSAAPRIGPGGVPMAQSGLDAPVDYDAQDSIVTDFVNKKVHLYKAGIVKYQDMTIQADHIVYDMETGIVRAEGWPDSTGKIVGIPVFKDATQEVEAKEMRYNFKSRKGVVYGVATTYDDLTIRGRKSKFLGSNPEDTTTQDVAYSQGAIISTCTHEEPHFGIRSQKQKIVNGKVVVVGPSNLEVMGVPTPLILPFGFFPMRSVRATGLIFPSDYEYSEQWGFGLRNVGWYFPLGDNINLTVLSNIYLKGTWGITLNSQYVKRYKYSGRLSLGFDSRRREDLSTGEVTRQQSFSIQVSHNQAPTAHPTNSFGGTINIQGNLYQQRVNNDPGNVLENQLNSNFSFRKVWQDKPLSMSLGLTHNQNTRTRNMTVSFPDFNFRTRNIYPFKDNKGGEEQFWETIVFQYNADVKNRFSGTDTTFFSQQTLDEALFGVRQQASVSNSLKLFKYISVNPSVNYQEVWYLRTLDKIFDPTPTVEVDSLFDDEGNLVDIVQDTLEYGTVDERLRTGFESWRDVNASLSFTSQLFGTIQFKKGWLRGIRHTLKPTLGFSFSPNADLDRYYREVQTDLRFPDEVDEFNIFEGAIFGQPPRGGVAANFNYGFNNIFEAKYWSKKDSTEKKFKIFDNIRVGGSHNFAADSLKWSPVSISGTTRLLNGITTVTVGAVFDPYILNEEGRRVNTFAWAADRKLLRFDNAQVRLNTSITPQRIRQLFESRKKENSQTGPGGRRSARQQRSEGGFLSLFEGFSINHNISFVWRDGFEIPIHAINVRGNIQLTPLWSINVGNFGYDFVRRGLSYPSVGFARDLHCWEMGMNWQPQRGTYSFFLRVKPGTFDFFKLPYERNNADAANAFN